MNYRADIHIVLFEFKDDNVNNKNFTMIGIVEEYDFRGLTDKELLKLVKVHKHISLQSFLGGGVSFPSQIKSEAIFKEEHLIALTDFIDTIPQEHIVLLNSMERYSLAMLSVICELAKEREKKVTSILSKPPEFMGKRTVQNYEYFAEKITAHSKKVIIVTSENIFDAAGEKCSMSAYYRYRDILVIDRLKELISNV